MIQPRRIRRAPMPPTTFVPVEPSDPIRADIPVAPGWTLTGLSVATHHEGDSLVPGRLYFVPAGWSRCVEGPQGPYLPACDRQPLRGDGSHEAIGWVAAIHASDCEPPVPANVLPLA